MKRTLSFRTLLLILSLAILILGIAYGFCFYLPLQKELAAISIQTQALDDQIAQSAVSAARMNVMQEDVDAFFQRPAAEQSEIAPYDNKTQVLAQLNRILEPSLEYRLQFSEPVTDENGIVRRNVSMTFRCADFPAVKAIIQDFAQCPWRCLISNLAITGSGDLLSDPVEVSATVTFLETTKRAP